MEILGISDIKIDWISKIDQERASNKPGLKNVIDNPKPMISWKLMSSNQGVMQKSYTIHIYSIEAGHKPGSLLWKTPIIESEESQYIAYQGNSLSSFTQYKLELSVTDNYGNECKDGMEFETGCLNGSEWKADFIEPEQPVVEEISVWKAQGQHMQQKISSVEGLTPCLYVRKKLAINKKVIKGRAYISAHGLYKLMLDSNEILDGELNPGFTSYSKYLEYQTYDVTDCLAEGDHALGLILADGWYCGHIGVTGNNCQYGNIKAAFVELHLTYDDGSKEVIVGDETFISSSGPLIYSDLFIGEKYDARAEVNWLESRYDDSSWQPVKKIVTDLSLLHSQYGNPVRIMKTLDARNITISPNKELLIDFGQVIAGRIRITLRNTTKGQEITLNHTEILDQEGNYFNAILGAFKDQEDKYICAGAEEEIYVPYFTFHGFRYVIIQGYQCDSLLDDIKAEVLCSDMNITGTFHCSNEKINQLYHNVCWSQYGNMVSIPTDCPQRERAGWTGDAEIFCETAALNMDVSAFYKRWMRNVRADQIKDGQIPMVVPYHKSYKPESIGVEGNESGAGWGDVITILPWKMFQAYGDISWLEENYDAMKAWLSYVKEQAENGLPKKYENAPKNVQERQKYLWNTGFNFGDWLAPSLSNNLEGLRMEEFPSVVRTKDEISTCYYANTVEILEKTARILGRAEEANHFKNLHRKIQEAFAEEYVDSNGRLESDVQGTYVIALAFHMIPESLRPKSGTRLKELIHKNEGCLDTGFLSIGLLMEELLANECFQEAYEIFYQEKCPSWLYEVNRGATTIWEDWMAIEPDGTIRKGSFNHYAFGCVGSFLYQRIAGLRIQEPGYKKIIINPDFSCRMEHVEATYNSIYGEIGIKWLLKDGSYFVDIVIPVNTQAQIILPGLDEIKMSGEYHFEGIIEE